MESYLLKNTDLPDLKLLKTALDLGAYKGFLKCLDSYRPKDVVDEIKASGLRGRGGGWYSTGEKWSSLKKVKNKPVISVVTAQKGNRALLKIVSL